ncbi:MULTISPECIES: copper homeostasis protein CutC [Streptococcus]|uniref:PF03932 family protein CutC n=1 Tax=Streptococcus oralis subsp. tigurinus 2426 TaxID=1333865 RepID=S9RG14_STROR|nr:MULTISPECIES: copper homeostasis protein CutC [Streptococcus]ANR75980.1 copper homeostasis protein CutC [Streptococcus sp. oral taxon 064]EMG34790.1 copper homeostasis protein CutC [Streptococcus oralis subsp. tigurinus 1366]EPX89241.1 copper homeostasis protein CutC [Streptococcus oralis subsp. tigurinus 2425]EPX90832.1 copper homeostasis protein CutC [Streptococcus oralis subsp. tigurinus 2426]KJQ77130.1 copper homeostasis protein CutC [Streptococcus oralis subsp. tigurinus]
MIYEFCAENVTLLEKAMQAGARRIELCDNLAVGGTTPSYGVTKAAVELAANYDTTIMTMIRPRGGDFVYTDPEIEIMLEDIRLTAQAGSQGVVFGALTADKKLDKTNLEKLIAASKGMEIVFHMAFDELSDEDQLEAIDWLSQAGVTRILTRAGLSGDSLEKRFDHYHRILEHAAGKIEILPGGGIDLDNRQIFIDQLGVTQLHGTKVVF